MLTFLSLAERKKPRWIVWENVPGVLSSNGGRDFATFLTALGQLGYGFAYRVLDAQYFGVAQRRRRVFVVGYLGDWRPAAAVLFERESVFGNPPTRGESWQEVTGPIAGCSNGGGANGPGRTAGDADTLVTSSVTSKWSKGTGGPSGDECQNLVAFHPTQDPISSDDGSTHAMGCGSKGGCCTQAVAVRTAQTSADGHGVAHDVTHTLDRVQGQAVAFSHSAAANSHGVAYVEEGTPPLRGGGAGNSMPAVAFNAYQRTEGQATWPLGASDGRKVEVGVRQAMAVRRLTPRECERLQGFPDDYTLVTYRNKPAADGPRYKALGNSMAVPVMRWIGERIASVDSLDGAT